jgi:hypothetical protein
MAKNSFKFVPEGWQTALEAMGYWLTPGKQNHVATFVKATPDYDVHIEVFENNKLKIRSYRKYFLSDRSEDSKTFVAETHLHVHRSAIGIPVLGDLVTATEYVLWPDLRPHSEEE